MTCLSLQIDVFDYHDSTARHCKVQTLTRSDKTLTRSDICMFNSFNLTRAFEHRWPVMVIGARNISKARASLP